MREVQQTLPHIDRDGYSSSTHRSPGPLTLRAEMESALKAGDIQRARAVEQMPRWNQDRCMARWKISREGQAANWRFSAYVLPLASRVFLSQRMAWPQVFHNCVILDILKVRDRELFKDYCNRPHFRRNEMDSASEWIGRLQPAGTLVWCAKNGMPTLSLMTGAMQNANVGNLMALIDHLEQNPPANPHEIGLWMKKNPMPGWFSGGKALENRLNAIQFRPPPKPEASVSAPSSSIDYFPAQKTAPQLAPKAYTLPGPTH